MKKKYDSYLKKIKCVKEKHWLKLVFIYFYNYKIS